MTHWSYEDRPEGRCIQLEGELDHDGCEEIQEAFRAAAQDASGPIVVDMGKISFVSSQGIWLLLKLHKELKREGRAMVVRAMQPHVHKVFETVGVFKAIPSWDSRTGAGGR